MVPKAKQANNCSLLPTALARELGWLNSQGRSDSLHTGSNSFYQCMKFSLLSVTEAVVSVLFYSVQSECGTQPGRWEESMCKETDGGTYMPKDFTTR